MYGKKVGKRLLTWVLVLVMTLSLLPLNVLAAPPVPAKVIRPDVDKYLTYEFYVDGALYGKQQIVKNGNTLLEPATPEKEGHRFTGWYYENGVAFTEFGEQSGITESKTITLHAEFKEVYYVYFHAPGENGNIVKTKEGTTGDKITFEDVTFAHEPNESITGWYTDKNYMNKVDSVTLKNANVDLYAKVETGHWITFDSNNGSYVAPQFVTDKTTEPTAPTRAGYTFAGWLLNGAAFSFGDALDADITLTAEWKAEETVSYTVIHWQENANDNEYSYKESETKTGAAGSETAATAKSYTGFTAQTIEQQTIAGDGSTIVNVYYTRNEYKVRFYNKYGTKEYENLAITAKYGEDISTQWPTYNGSSTWRTKPNGTTCQSSIQTMPLNGANFYGPKTGEITETAYYYLQVLPGHEQDPHVKEYNGKYYKKDHEDTAVGSDLSITDEDHYNIAGFIFREYEATKFFLSNKYHYNNAKFYYDRIDYKFTFKNGEVETPFTKKYQESLNDLSNKVTPTAPAGKEGYDFAGWYSNELCQGDAFNFDSTMPAQNIIVYAKWAAPVHTVTFKVDGQPDQKLENIAHKDTITLPENPTPPAGEEFLGWVDKDGKPFNPETKITGDLTLCAKFGSKTGYGVTYNTTGGNGTKVNDSNCYGKDAAATVLDGARTALPNMVFLYWVDSDGKAYYPNSKVTINGDVTLTAVYGATSQPVSITYHSTFNDASKTYDALANNAKITVMDYSATGLDEREGYTFAGWNTQADGDGATFEAGMEARVDNDGENHLYAKWTADDAKIAFVTNGGSTVADMTGKTGDVINPTTMPSTSKNGYTFAGWFGNKELTGDAVTELPEVFPAGTTTYYAKWTADDATIKFVTNGGSAIEDMTGKTGDAISSRTMPTTTKSGYTFGGWFDNEGLTGTAVTQLPETFPAGTTTYYAKWTADDAKIAFVTNGGSTVADMTGKTGDVINPTTMPSTTKNGYTFDGWYANAEFSGTAVTQLPAAFPAGTTTYYAKWTANDAKITFVTNGGSAVADKNGKTGDTINPTTMPSTTKNGHTFAGWYANAEFSGDAVTQLPAAFPAGTTTYYAKWNTNYVPYYPPAPPTVKIEDDDALGLNTTDHFAYIVGYGNGEVRPQNNITRAEVATIFFRLLTDDVRDENLTKTNRYSDVAATSWYNTAVSTLSSMGIITGYPDGTFRPNAAITRAEFAAIAARFDNDGDKTAAKFSDIATHWAKDEISIAYNNGWITGYPDGTFGPQRDITRAETMTLVNRVLNRQPETEDDLLPNMTVWTDNANPKAWYYLAVQEATNSHYYKFKTNSKYEKWTELRETRDWTQLEK